MPALTGPGPLTLLALLAELVPALEHIHGLGLVHRDLKPENIFLRSHEPFDLVLGDFGLVRLVEGSVHLAVGDGTPAYLPPEADKEEAEVTSSWDWWSLGMICAELAGGRHPFADASAAQIRRHFAAQKPVDLEAVTDERELLLCRGLLVANRQQRWGAEQVRAWLAGESPALPATAATPAAAAAGRRTVLFADAEYTDGASLAAAFQTRWDEALQKLFQERERVLVDELAALLRAEGNTEALAALADQVLPAEVGVRFARLLVEMDPGLTPQVGAVTATPAGLERAALEVVQHPGERSSLAGALRTVRDCAVLRSWRGLEGMARGPEIERDWLTLIEGHEQATRARSTMRLDPELAAAWLLLVVLDPERRLAEVRERVDQGTATPAAETTWWAALAGRRDEPAAQVTALLTQGAAAMQGQRLAEERQQELEASRRAKEETRRAEEKTRRAETQRAQRVEEIARLTKATRERALRDFAGDKYDDLAALAAAFQARWDEALRRLVVKPDRVLVDALATQLRKQGSEKALAALQEKSIESPSRHRAADRLASILIEMDPELKPQLGSISITREGLKRAALEFVESPEQYAELGETMRIVRTSAVLTIWSGLPGCLEGPKIAAAWNDHVAALESRSRLLNPKDWRLRPSDANVAAAWLLLMIVDPEQLGLLRKRICTPPAGPAATVAWWRTLAEEVTPASLVIALLSKETAELEGPRADAEGRQASKKKALDQAQLAKEHTAQDEGARSTSTIVEVVLGVALFQIVTVVWLGSQGGGGGVIFFLLFAIVDFFVVALVWH